MKEPTAKEHQLAKRDAARYRKQLQALTGAVKMVLDQMDELMKGPSTVERGRAIGRLMGQLEYANDSARHFGLGEKLTVREQKKAPRSPKILGEELEASADRLPRSSR